MCVGGGYTYIKKLGAASKDRLVVKFTHIFPSYEKIIEKIFTLRFSIT